jgi:hypothetical protein
MYSKELVIETSRFSNRNSYNTDANGNSIEGGALNANYTTVDAVGNVCNFLGKHGYTYRKDFIWDDHGWTDDMSDGIVLQYNDPKLATLLGIKNG